MKKLLATLFALSLVFCLCACAGNDNSADDKATANEIKAVVKNAVRCTTEIFEVRTLAFEENALKDDYHIVTDDQFKTYADLEAFVKSTYVDSVAEQILKGEGVSRTVYLDVDGKLCIDVSTILPRGYFVNWDNYSVTVKASRKTPALLSLKQL